MRFIIILALVMFFVLGYLNYPQNKQATFEPSQERYLKEANFYRERAGNKPIQSGLHLKEWAEKRACEVAKFNKEDGEILSHRGFYEFFEATPIQGRLAENLSSNRTAETVIGAWYLSFKHGEAMLSESYRYMWVAQCENIFVQLLN